jgi:hypothetical protein
VENSDLRVLGLHGLEMRWRYTIVEKGDAAIEMDGLVCGPFWGGSRAAFYRLGCLPFVKWLLLVSGSGTVNTEGPVCAFFLRNAARRAEFRYRRG